MLVGTKVLWRNRVLGRNNVHDCWESFPYKVVDKLDNKLYPVKPEDDVGDVCHIHRVNMRVYSYQHNLEDEGELDSIKTDTDEGNHDHLILDALPDVSTGRVSRSSVSDVTSKVKGGTNAKNTTRRSRRVNAVKHPNPHNLPWSANQNL